jgi:hypothetical protein
MKKFLIGCLAVFVLVSLVGGFFAYRYVYLPAQRVIQNAEKFTQMADLEKQIQNIQEFIRPNDDLLSQAQVERFLAVQNQMRETLREKMDVLESKYKELENKSGNLNILQTLQGYGDMVNLIIEAKKAQIAALNAQGFSLPEYKWVKEQVIAAAGIPFKGIDWSNPEAEPQITLPTAPQANVDLVAPFKETLEKTIGLSFFGL